MRLLAVAPDRGITPASVAPCTFMGGLREPDASLAKRCRHCGETKPTDAFSPDRRHRDGLHSWCRRVWPRRSAAGVPRTARATTPPAGSSLIRLASAPRVDKGSRPFVEISVTAAAGVVSTGIWRGLAATPLSRWSKMSGALPKASAPLSPMVWSMNEELESDDTQPECAIEGDRSKRRERRQPRGAGDDKAPGE
jgi:hypothetical protein